MISVQYSPLHLPLPPHLPLASLPPSPSPPSPPVTLAPVPPPLAPFPASFFLPSLPSSPPLLPPTLPLPFLLLSLLLPLPTLPPTLPPLPLLLLLHSLSLSYFYWGMCWCIFHIRGRRGGGGINDEILGGKNNLIGKYVPALARWVLYLRCFEESGVVVKQLEHKAKENMGV